jgi:hypothetical protein
MHKTNVYLHYDTAGVDYIYNTIHLYQPSVQIESQRDKHVLQAWENIKQFYFVNLMGTIFTFLFISYKATTVTTKL